MHVPFTEILVQRLKDKTLGQQLLPSFPLPLTHGFPMLEIGPRALCTLTTLHPNLGVSSRSTRPIFMVPFQLFLPASVGGHYTATLCMLPCNVFTSLLFCLEAYLRVRVSLVCSLVTVP